MFRIATLALLTLTLSAGAALACLDVELAFDPAEAAVGEPVTFFASIANLGDVPVDAELELSILWNDFELGPIPGMLPLAAGEELSAELGFIAFFPGSLTLTLTATAGTCSDTATATLVVTGNGGATAGDVRRLGEALLEELGAIAPVSVEDSSWGSVKGLYR